MEQQTLKPTEIVCWPERIEFGGVVWTKRADLGGQLRYDTYVKGCGERYISQYDNSCGRNSGRWFWNADISAKLIGIELLTLHKSVSGIEDEFDSAMMCALDAELLLMADIGTLLNTLNPDSEYSKGFEAGKQALLRKVEEALQ